MIIGVVSDTHDYVRGARLAAKAFVEHGVELVIHLGDLVAPFMFSVFRDEGVKNLVMVFGNNDGDRALLAKIAAKYGYEVYDSPYILQVGGKKLLLMHGIRSLEETRQIVDSIAASGNFDIVAYGHTHRVDVRRVGSTLVLNPGEAAGCLTGKVTAAILDLKNLEVKVLELGLREDTIVLKL